MATQVIIPPRRLEIADQQARQRQVEAGIQILGIVGESGFETRYGLPGARCLHQGKAIFVVRFTVIGGDRQGLLQAGHRLLGLAGFAEQMAEVAPAPQI